MNNHFKHSHKHLTELNEKYKKSLRKIRHLEDIIRSLQKKLEYIKPKEKGEGK